MAENFKNLRVWQEARKLALEVYLLTNAFPEKERFSLTNQLQRAGVSVAANIAEGCGRYTAKDKIQFMLIARGSATETQSHLSIALGLRYITIEQFNKIEDNYESLIRGINAFINHLRKPKTD